MKAGRDLGGLAAVAAVRAGLTGAEPFPVFLVGSVLQHSGLVREALLDCLKSRCPGAMPEVPRQQPIFGAVLLALEEAGAVDPTLREKLMDNDLLRA